ncbi:MAG: pyridoxal-phosphate dependent enzyme [Fulvivirga sp.]|nr:pyridoxal-phosphate dependent enzyme [Fulvivirga sp.]
MTLVKTPLWFKRKCLYCDHHENKTDYNSVHFDEDWKNQYRVIDLELNPSKGKSEIIESFNNYDFESPQGLLQYKALPNRHQASPMSMHVGATPLFQLDQFSHHYSTNLYVKAEGFNPSGCFKDRETIMCLLNALDEGHDKAVIYSSGNAASSAAIFAQANNMHLITFVSGDTYPEKIDYIRAHGSDVIVIGDKATNFEEGYRMFCKIRSGGYFIQHGYDNWSVTNPFRVQGDKTIALEIIHQLSEGSDSWQVPDYVIIPTANGSCMAGVWKGFQELYDLKIIDKLPKMISVGIKNANPVFKAIQQGQFQKPVICDISKLDEDDAQIGSIILAEEGYDSIEAAKSVVESGGTAVEVDRHDIEYMYHHLLQDEKELVEKNNLVPEPASLISIAAVEHIKSKYNLGRETKVVSVITGSGFKARKKIREIMVDDPQNLAVAEEALDARMKNQYPKATEAGKKMIVPADLTAVSRAFDKMKR